MHPSASLSERHTWARATTFRLKVLLLTGWRQLQNWRRPLPRFGAGSQLAGAPILATSASDLWNPDDNAANWLLTAGKVENLRRAARRLHGLVVPAGATFSFWRQVGNPNFGRGYVLGREIREGCVVPTVAGGLCQLSNALYDAALRAGFAIVERHRHTQVIKGSLAEQDRDATVKWNYLDLRFQAPIAFRLDVTLTADQLVVSFRGEKPAPDSPSGPVESPRPASALHDCYSCGNLGCFRHPGQVPARPAATRTTFVLDAGWPEFAQYVQATAGPADVLVMPPARQPATALAALPQAIILRGAAWRRQLSQRLASRLGRNVFAQSLRGDAQVAAAAARHLRPDSTHLVVAQTLLPFLWQAGVLGGRTFDVLLTRLPAEVLHTRLDAAHARYPASLTLHDFRAEAAFVEAESCALTQARRLLTPHHELARLFSNKALLLEWAAPAPAPRPVPGTRILFPASALARKGAHEMRRLAQELHLPLVVAGRATEHAGFWQDVTTTPAGPDPLAGVGLVVYPAYVEHQPRLLLRALAAGIPVVATAACGLGPRPGLTLVPAGDYSALRQAVEQALAGLQTLEKRAELTS